MRLSTRFSSRVSRRGGGAAAGGCLLARARGAAVRAMLFISSRPASRPFAAWSVEAGASSIPSCLLGGGDGVYVRGVPCLSRLPVRLSASACLCGGG